MKDAVYVLDEDSLSCHHTHNLQVIANYKCILLPYISLKKNREEEASHGNKMHLHPAMRTLIT